MERVVENLAGRLSHEDQRELFGLVGELVTTANEAQKKNEALEKKSKEFEKMEQVQKNTVEQTAKETVGALMDVLTNYLPELAAAEKSRESETRVAEELAGCPNFMNVLAPMIPIAASAIKAAAVNNRVQEQNEELRCVKRQLSAFQRRCGTVQAPSNVWEAPPPKKAVPVLASNGARESDRKRCTPDWLQKAMGDGPSAEAYRSHKMSRNDLPASLGAN